MRSLEETIHPEIFLRQETDIAERMAKFSNGKPSAHIPTSPRIKHSEDVVSSCTAELAHAFQQRAADPYFFLRDHGKGVNEAAKSSVVRRNPNWCRATRWSIQLAAFASRSAISAASFGYCVSSAASSKHS